MESSDALHSTLRFSSKCLRCHILADAPPLRSGAVVEATLAACVPVNFQRCPIGSVLQQVDLRQAIFIDSDPPCAFVFAAEHVQALADLQRRSSAIPDLSALDASSVFDVLALQRRWSLKHTGQFSMSVVVAENVARQLFDKLFSGGAEAAIERR